MLLIGRRFQSIEIRMFKSRYAVRFAESPREIHDALRLRYEVFNLEMNEGLLASHATGIDEDEFDAVCSSLSSKDPALGHAMYQKFAKKGALADPSFVTKPLPQFALPLAEPLEPCPPPPKLLRSYLGVGAKICGEPDIDREFETIDFLTLLDCRHGSPIATERFLERPNGIKEMKESKS